MNKKLLVLIVVVSILSVIFVGGRYLPKGVAQGVDDPVNHTISVTGEGIVEVVPDIAYLNFGVSVEDPDPQKAMDLLSAKANPIVATLTNLGIPRKKLKLQILVSILFIATIHKLANLLLRVIELLRTL